MYKVPVAKSEDGIPIGNGRVGTLVWTTPGALKFQINRVDSDYMEDAAFVDVELSGTGADVFTADATTQHLSVYEGLLDVKAAGVNALCSPGINAT